MTPTPMTSSDLEGHFGYLKPFVPWEMYDVLPTICLHTNPEA